MRVAIVFAAAAAVLCLSAGCNTISEALLVARKLSEPPESMIGASGPYANRNAMTPVRNDGDAINPDDVDAALKAMSAPGGTAAQPGKAPADQEISVNLIYAGLTPAAQGKNLDFDFKAFWGTYKSSAEAVSMPAGAKRGEAKLDLGIARMTVVPKIVSGTRGNYSVTLSDPAGSLIGVFNITDSGQQVTLSSSSSKYDTRLAYYHIEERLTGYEVFRKGSNKPEFGVIFVGKGWSTVEGGKKPDMSKGYLFPEVDVVVLPKAWLDYHEMEDSCNTLKRGDPMPGGGICYSCG